MNKIDLTPYNILRPEKLEWYFPSVQTDEDIFTAIKSKSLRSFLRKTDLRIEQVGITWEHRSISYQEYLQWLAYYVKKMKEQNFSIFATESWYQEKISEGKEITGIFLYKSGTMIGSTIISVQHLDLLATSHFKASEHLHDFSDRNSSLGAIIDFLFLRTMRQKGIRNLSSGRARNAAGIFNSYGYIDYKLRFGFVPTVITDMQNFDSAPLSEDGTVLFFGVQNEQLVMVGCRKKNSDFEFESKRFATEEMPFVLLEY